MAPKLTGSTVGAGQHSLMDPWGQAEAEARLVGNRQTRRGGWGHRIPLSSCRGDRWGWRASQGSGKEPQVSQPNVTRYLNCEILGAREATAQRKWRPGAPALIHMLLSLRSVVGTSKAKIRLSAMTNWPSTFHPVRGVWASPCPHALFCQIPPWETVCYEMDRSNTGLHSSVQRHLLAHIQPQRNQDL